jgi:hypothetical protein
MGAGAGAYSTPVAAREGLRKQRMPSIMEAKWQALEDGLDTPAILRAVDALDRIRAELANPREGGLSAMRDELLQFIDCRRQRGHTGPDGCGENSNALTPSPRASRPRSTPEASVRVALLGNTAVIPFPP